MSEVIVRGQPLGIQIRLCLYDLMELLSFAENIDDIDVLAMIQKFPKKVSAP